MMVNHVYSKIFYEKMVETNFNYLHFTHHKIRRITDILLLVLIYLWHFLYNPMIAHLHKYIVGH